MRFAVRDK